MSKVFKQGNWDNDTMCPICETKKEGEVVLIPIYGSQKDNISEAKQVHLECLLKHLVIYPEQHIIALQYK